jgi:hypothetical protein
MTRDAETAITTGGGSSPGGIPPFHVHPGHAFEGFELVESRSGSPILVTRCACGTVLDVADAQFAGCPDCSGHDPGCVRCQGTGRVIDHSGLAWRASPAVDG